MPIISHLTLWRFTSITTISFTVEVFGETSLVGIPSKHSSNLDWMREFAKSRASFHEQTNANLRKYNQITFLENLGHFRQTLLNKKGV